MRRWRMVIRARLVGRSKPQSRAPTANGIAAIRVTEQSACPELGSRIAILRSGGKPYETYFDDWCRAVRCNACTDRVRLGQTGHGPDGHAGRYGDPGQGRSWTRPYGPRRARPSLRLGPRPRTSLWLAPSLTPSSRETALAIPLLGRNRIPGNN